MSGIWPGNTKCVAALSFDLDGITGAINRNPDAWKMPSLLSYREYGPRVGVPRILDLMDDYGIKTSFYVPGYIVDTYPALVEEIKRRGHEIGHHGYMHEPPTKLTRDEEIEVLEKGIESIVRVTGERPKGYRSPSWELSEHSLGLLQERGFLYDTSLMGDDVPYMVEANGKPFVEIPIHWELDDAPYFNYSPSLNATNVQSSPEHVYQVWSECFDGIHHYGRSFVLTMHPFIIGRPGRLRMLERLLKHIGGFDAVEFMRTDHLAASFAEREAAKA